ncbi:ATP-binding protein [Lachnoclostridium pacaense]|uniref:ATP-binding protein n=1 Tax=Enterocloster hominis (ex Hitch et al. 2024) TaxID=1917870 RepID=UPI001D1209D8|nr:ATP-binding protein [Lachnoclostridium pacaense]MCC2878297.1 ATP-binding protein [Lachnoclostridium pacaense]
MVFDFTPDPKVLLALTRTPMKPIDALCELIDNAIDSFSVAKVQGIKISNPMVLVTLPTRKQLATGTGIVRIQDNGPGLTPENAEKAIKAGFSGNNPYDTLGLFGMGFNISTGKFGNTTTFITARKESNTYIKTIINLTHINSTKNYQIPAQEIPKGDNEPFNIGANGTIIEISGWWLDGNANKGFINELVKYGDSKIREAIGRRYATILRESAIKIVINDNKCEPFEHCIWDANRYITRRNGIIPAVISVDKIIRSSKRCGRCTAIIQSSESICPSCGASEIRTIDERIWGWVGIQRFDSDTNYGIDLIRNGRAIRIAEQRAFFEYVNEFQELTKDYPIDSQYGRIVGEIHLDFVPVDFMKQDFQRSSDEWNEAMLYLRGNSSLQPNKPGADKNDSPIFKLYQGYRRVRNFGKSDMYMGYWDADSKSAKRISRETEADYYKKFKNKEPGFYDDTEWWKLVESADHPPVAELIECPKCGAQNLKEVDCCNVCGEIFKGKDCLNPECRKNIPMSAQSCPYCGSSQVPMIYEPWVCLVCGTKNIATNSSCINCNNTKGTVNPLEKEELLKVSDRIDNLSSDSLIIKLADGVDSNPLKVQTYAVQRPMNTYRGDCLPLLIFKDVGKISIFIDKAHRVFHNCGIRAEQVIANEIAMYLYDERRNHTNYLEYNLTNLAWKVLQKRWGDVLELSTDAVATEAKVLLSEVRDKIRIALGKDAEYYFDDLSKEQKKFITDTMIENGIDLSDIADLKSSGEYLNFVSFDFLLTLFTSIPEIFFNKGVWDIDYSSKGEEILGKEIIDNAKQKLKKQYANCLEDVVSFENNKYSDVTALERVRLSIKFLYKRMVQ